MNRVHYTHTNIFATGDWKLMREHAYYYQIQMQMNVCDVGYGDFVVWTEKEIAVERISIDREFYEGLMDDVAEFFTLNILPEIVGKWYTRQNVADDQGIVPVTKHHSSSDPPEEDPDKSWCYCGEPYYGKMIFCEHPRCTIQWFHFDCLRIRQPPKSKWYCPSCRKIPKPKTS